MKTVTKIGTLILFVLTVTILATSGTAISGEDVRYSTHIKQIFDNKCTACHGSESPEYKEFKKDKKKYKAMFKGPRMDSYTYLIYFVGWPDTGALMRRLDDGENTKDGKPGNMYQYLGDNDKERRDNLKLFKKWVGNWSLKRWQATTKDELNKIKIDY